VLKRRARKDWVGVFKPTLYLMTFAGWGLGLDRAAAGAKGWSGDFMFEQERMRCECQVRGEVGELTLRSP